MLAAKKVMQQSLLEAPPSLIPGLEAALPMAARASTSLPLLAVVMSVVALAASMLAVGLVFAR